VSKKAEELPMKKTVDQYKKLHARAIRGWPKALPANGQVLMHNFF
jgi:hypothetical protein